MSRRRPMAGQPPAPRRRARGVSLIEVMVAVLVLAFALLGLASMQTRALRTNVSALQRSQASMLGQYMLDLLRVDRDTARGGAYNTGSNFICVAGAFSSANALAQASLVDWLADVKQNIGTPGDATTCVSVRCSADYVCTVQIRWDDSRAGGEPEQQLTLSSRL